MQTAPDLSEDSLMDPHMHTLRRNSETLPSRQGLSRQCASYCCPHCSKEYKTSTWLDNHIKAKHSASDAQGLSQLLADMIHNRQSIAYSASLLPQSLVAEDPHHFTLIRELQATASLFKSLLPRIDALVALLQEPNGVHSTSRSIERGPPRDLKRRVSSRDLHGQNKRQGISTSASDFPILQTTNPMLFNEFESRNPSQVPASWKGDCFGLDSSEHSRGFARYPSFVQVQGIHLPLSQQTTLSSQAPASEFSQRGRKSRSSQVPKTQSPTGNATQTYQALSRQQQEQLSPCEQLAAYPHGTSPASLAPEWALRESMGLMADTPLQKSLDLLSHDPGEHFSSFGELQQSLDYLGPASQDDIANAFGQTPQQDDFSYGLSVDPSDFLALPMQPGEALGD